MTTLHTPSADTLTQAGSCLRQGGLVAMPTETVYGLAADATNTQAVARIFAAKGRPSFNPLITHVTTLDSIAQHAHLDDRAHTLAHSLWPGPLTLILPRKDTSTISPLVTAGLPTLAFRIPAHPIAKALIEAAGRPLAAPSANPSGMLSPTTPLHVAETLGNKVDMILAAGATDVGLESTVIDLSTPTATLLRPGTITAEQVSQALGAPVDTNIKHTKSNTGEHSSITSPGQLLKHYAPRTALRLNAIDLTPGEALLAFGSITFMGIQGGGAAKELPSNALQNLSETHNLHEAAANLFKMLHTLDKGGFHSIAVMNIPHTGLGIAINDRLHRAAQQTEQT